MQRRYITVDVFTDRAFGGNPLAVVLDAEGLSTEQMQAIATEFNYSETTFVLPPADKANDANVRIFTVRSELPFAGHPNVGTAFVLARHGRDRDGGFLFEEMAGLVDVKVRRDAQGVATGAVIAAPQALSRYVELSVDDIAACASIASSDVVTSAHRPIQASVGVKFILAEVKGDALTRALPDVAAYRKLDAATPALDKRVSIFLYARDGDNIRARMFAPLAGTFEDPATGSASATLAALLLSLDGGDKASFTLTQGVEMKRPSLLHLTAHRAEDGYRATVGGECAPMFRGEVTL